MSSISAQPSAFVGLFSSKADAIPLLGVQIEADIRNAASRVRVSQRYRNAELVPVEAVYSFPLEDGSAVCGFKVEIGDKIVEGRVEEKEKAFEKYDDAMADGHGAFLLDQDRPNIFTASVGNLLPGQEAVVSITYVSELLMKKDRLCLRVPTTISPRYVPPEKVKKMDPVDLDHINPPVVYGGVPYGLTLSVDIETSEKIQAVESPSHPVRLTFSDNKARVELTGENIQLDQDFVLTFQFAEPHKPSVILTRDKQNDGYVAMLNFFPEIPEGKKQPQDIVFMLDRSGSMQGESIVHAKKALLLCLKSMNEGDRFNIVGFGSSYESLFPSSVPYDQVNLDRAVEHVRMLDANLGGTETYNPLQKILAESLDSPKQIMLITDGEVGNEDDILRMACKYKGKARIFTLGIGRGVNEHFIKSLASVTNAAAEFIHPGESIERKVVEQFSRIYDTSFANIAVDWGMDGLDFMTPRYIPGIYSGCGIVVYGKFNRLEQSRVELSATSPVGQLSWGLDICPEKLVEDEIVPLLMARSRIRDFEEDEVSGVRGSSQVGRNADRTRKKIVALGCKYQLLTSVTSFVGIERRKDIPVERAQLRRVPIALTKGWGGNGVVLGRSIDFLGRSIEERGCPMLSNAFEIDREINCNPPERPLNNILLERSLNTIFQIKDLLTELALLQNVDGSWDLDENLAELAKIDINLLKDMAKEIDAPEDVSHRIVATALAIWVLRTRLPEKEPEWSLIVDKAKKWIGCQSVKPPQKGRSFKEWVFDFLSF